MNIAFIGLGTMGAGMARRLMQAGHSLTVYNRTAERAEPFAAEGAKIAGSPAKAAAQAEMVIVMVADDTASRSSWLGIEGALASARPGTILMDSSTLSVAWIRELAAAAATHNCPFIEAPVTGSKMQAEGGELVFLTGGDAAVINSVRPILATMSRAIAHLGPAGSGATMKLMNNFLCAVQAVSLGEALAVIEKSGLNRDAAFDILCNGAPGSPMLKGVGKRMMARDYRVNFTMNLMHKDMSYAMDEGERNGVFLTMAEAARDQLQAGISAGMGDKDFSAVAELNRTSESNS
jgi:3-hydroxyisobutyrate dehydrogenase